MANHWLGMGGPVATPRRFVGHVCAVEAELTLDNHLFELDTTHLDGRMTGRDVRKIGDDVTP
jgi:hypothetical protein